MNTRNRIFACMIVIISCSFLRGMDHVDPVGSPTPIKAPPSLSLITESDALNLHNLENKYQMLQWLCSSFKKKKYLDGGFFKAEPVEVYQRDSDTWKVVVNFSIEYPVGSDKSNKVLAQKEYIISTLMGSPEKIIQLLKRETTDDSKEILRPFNELMRSEKQHIMLAEHVYLNSEKSKNRIIKGFKQGFSRGIKQSIAQRINQKCCNAIDQVFILIKFLSDGTMKTVMNAQIVKQESEELAQVVEALPKICAAKNNQSALNREILANYFESIMLKN